jgi:hypothetical protein
MPDSKLIVRVRIIGLVSSIVAVAPIGVTLEADNWISGFGGSVTRSERIFLRVVAALICLGHFVLRLARRPSVRPSSKWQEVREFLWRMYAFGEYATDSAVD